MLIVVNGTSLPGTRFEGHAGIRVGLRVGDEIAEPVAADVLDVDWMTDVRVRPLDDGYDYVAPRFEADGENGSLGWHGSTRPARSFEP